MKMAEKKQSTQGNKMRRFPEVVDALLATGLQHLIDEKKNLLDLKVSKFWVVTGFLKRSLIMYYFLTKSTLVATE